jgi:AcrR family transcriptional regulator
MGNDVRERPITRRPKRRELILSEAAKLFREHGFHAVGIDDIGAAAGISGPGVYRHFESKEAVLEALIDLAHSRLIDGAERIIEQGLPPRATLERLIRWHIQAVLDDPTVIAVYFLEARHLSPDARLRRRRRERLYVEHWTATVADLRDDLVESYLRMAVQSVLWLINSYSLQRDTLDPDQVEELMTAMALAALAAPLPSSGFRSRAPSESL